MVILEIQFWKTGFGFLARVKIVYSIAIQFHRVNQNPEIFIPIHQLVMSSWWNKILRNKLVWQVVTSFKSAHDSVETSEAVLELSHALHSQHPPVEGRELGSEIESDWVEEDQTADDTDVGYCHVQSAQKVWHLKTRVEVFQSVLKMSELYIKIFLKNILQLCFANVTVVWEKRKKRS